MKQSGLSLSVTEGNCTKFKDYIKCESNVRFIIQRDGLLHMACRYGHVDIVKELLKMGAPCDQRHGNHDRLPLHEACTLGNKELMEVIAEASKNHIDEKDGHGLTAAHICTMNGELNSLKKLVACGASLTEVDNEGMQLGHWAAKRNHAAIILYLFDLEMDLNKVCVHGRSPLHYAAISNSLKALESLVKCHGDIALGDQLQATPIHLAAKHGSLECLRYLVTLGISLSVRQKDGKTPAHLAALTGSYECLHWLLDNGADIAAIDDESNTIGHMACRSGKGEVMFCYMHHGGPTDIKNTKGEDLNQIARRYSNPVKYDMAKKAEIVCPLCQLETNKKDWDQQHAPTVVVRNINNSQHSLFQSPLGSYTTIVKQHSNAYREKRIEITRRNLETINIGKEVPKKEKMAIKPKRSGSAYRDLITRYYGEYISNQ